MLVPTSPRLLECCFPGTHLPQQSTLKISSGSGPFQGCLLVNPTSPKRLGKVIARKHEGDPPCREDQDLFWISGAWSLVLKTLFFTAQQINHSYKARVYF